VEALVSKRTDDRPLAGFNLVAAIGGEGLGLHWDGALRTTRFGGGAHVISSNYDLDDPAMPEKAVFDAWAGSGTGVDALQAFLTSHEGRRPVCKHSEGDFGTVSSSIYIAGRAGRRYLHADGAPCRVGFSDYSALLRR
jgi:hypothetical protein